jgi:hypothetical protein
MKKVKAAVFTVLIAFAFFAAVSIAAAECKCGNGCGTDKPCCCEDK